MPELPEVQNFVNELNKYYVGLEIKEINFHRKDLRYPFQVPEISKVFASGVILKKCYRVGKQLVLETPNGAVNVSLGMSGCFKPIESQLIEKHQHVSIFFKNGTGVAYVDPRRFGYWKLRDTDNINSSVCDPLSSTELETLFCSNDIFNKVTSIKDLLMDQKKIGGIGNIYAVEVLHLTGIHPLKSCINLTDKDWKSLAREIPKLLLKAIQYGGSSISSYRSLNGKKGEFQELHKVYGRTGEKCLKIGCKGTIQRIVQKNRSSWFCSNCQK